jgi:hypothetical protein
MRRARSNEDVEPATETRPRRLVCLRALLGRPLTLLGFAFLLPGASVLAQSEWTVRFDATVVATDMTGSLTFSEIDTPADLDLAELLTRKEGFTVGLELWRGAWGVLAGIQLLELEKQSTTAINNVFTRKVEETIGKIAIGWQPAPAAVVFAGVRTWDTSLMFELGPPTTASLDGSDRWVDPIVGGSLYHDFGQGWFAALNADIGGFGMSSDLTWNAKGSAGYQVSNTLSLLLAYRALGVDYTTASSAVGGTVTYDTIRHGPQIGLALTF